MKLDTWDRAWSLLQTIEHGLSKELRQSFDLGISEFRTLYQLRARSDREIRMLELSDILQLSQSSTTRLVERLERKGFVTRDSCPSDGRGKFCVLSKSGEAFILRVAPKFEESLDRVLSGVLSASEAKSLTTEIEAWIEADLSTTSARDS